MERTLGGNAVIPQHSVGAQYPHVCTEESANPPEQRQIWALEGTFLFKQINRLSGQSS